ncbi:MAG: metallophosphoesterase [Planctomycetota bacterium]
MNNFKRSLNNIAILCLLISTGIAFAEEIKTQKTEPAAFTKGTWTAVVIPDTQHYVSGKFVNTDTTHKILNGMMDWIAAEKDSRNIKMVVHVGDMTNNNNQQQWELIRSAYKKLDNVVPYVLCEGNHDRGKNKKTKTIIPTLMNDFFSIDQNSKNQDIYRGSFEPGQMQNSYYTFTQNNQKYLVLALEYKTRQAVIKWAGKIIKDHPDHRVFMTVHNYMDESSRIQSKDGLPVPNKGPIRNFVMNHPNIEFVVCGHHAAIIPTKDLPPESVKSQRPAHGHGGEYKLHKDIATGHRTDRRENGLSVHQILFNAQWIPNGGDGWMLLLEFQPDNKTVRAKTFSSHLNLWRTGPEYDYTLMRTEDKKTGT